MRIVLLAAALLAAPLLAAAPAAAHTVTCSATDVVCVATCNVHVGIGVHECRILWPLAAESSAWRCWGNPAAVQVCWTGTEPGCWDFTVAHDPAHYLDFCTV